MVFLGVWALFGIGTLAGGRQPSPSALAADHIGRVLARTTVPVAAIPTAMPESPLADSILSAQLAGEPDVFHYVETSSDVSTLNDPGPPPTMEHIIGRISAWICTTLYLTSRLPQIWKNVSVRHVYCIASVSRLLYFSSLGSL